MYSFNKYLSEDMFNEYFSYYIVYTIQTPLNAFHVPQNHIMVHEVLMIWTPSTFLK